uniref:Proteasome subunit alpha type-2-like n=2 Tax=Cyanistes caeruleus TaxID=156563 RepID=A0A8C0U3Q3_CYACU
RNPKSKLFTQNNSINRLLLLQGAYFAWKATAMGKNYVNGKTFLEKRYNEDLELEDAIHTAILTLKESFEGQMTEDNIEVGICNEAGFRRLTPTEVKDYLAAIA